MLVFEIVDLDENEVCCLFECIDEFVELGLVIEVFGLGVIVVCEMLVLLKKLDV